MMKPGRMPSFWPSRVWMRLFLSRAHDDDAHFFYSFPYIFAHLGVQLPFSRFICDVLTIAQIVPTQVTPKSDLFVESEGFPPLMKHIDGKAKFPFYWARKPCHKLDFDLDALTYEEGGIIEFLVSNV